MIDTLPGPRVDSRDLEPVVPGPAVLALALGTRTHSVAMGLALFPAPTVGPAVVEIKPAPRGVFLVGGDAAGGQLCRGSRGLSCGHGLEMHS